jgi:sirohydrochlorin cobaltochelatase
MIGVWHSFETGAVCPVFLRETLGRQTGMYRVTQKVTDSQARSTIDAFCAGCLKHRLWEISGSNPEPLEPTPGELPLICHEACNLLIGEIRKVVKNAPASEPAITKP